ncbi:MAG: chromate transporter [Coprobacillus sp.]|nr:chromate transporter [Coprobacillus sp.]MCI9092457.1 chromate transporter [Coprobacillus sp.]
MKKDILFKLFISTLYLSAFTFGGGYVIISLMKKKFVDEYHWIEEKEILDLVAIAQSAPGPIAVNGAIVLGYKLCGVLGIIVSVIATILPPFFIISFVSFFYQLFKENLYIRFMLEGMQAGVSAVIIGVVYEMASGLLKQKNSLCIIIMICSFIANYIFKINVVIIIIICICIGLIQSIYMKRRIA